MLGLALVCRYSRHLCWAQFEYSVASVTTVMFLVTFSHPWTPRMIENVDYCSIIELTLELNDEDEYDISVSYGPCSRTGVTCVASDSHGIICLRWIHFSSTSLGCWSFCSCTVWGLCWIWCTCSYSPCESTTNLSRQNLRLHTWHQYVNKVLSWRVETSYSSSTLSSKVS